MLLQIANCLRGGSRDTDSTDMQAIVGLLESIRTSMIVGHFNTCRGVYDIERLLHCIMVGGLMRTCDDLHFVPQLCTHLLDLISKTGVAPK